MKKILIGLLIAVFVIVVGVSGKIVVDNYRIQRMDIESVSVTYGGGFGTQAGTQAITITAAGDEVTLSAHVYDKKTKMEEVLVQKCSVTKEEIDTFYAFVRKNWWKIRYLTFKDRSILDAGNTYITLNDERNGGYGVSSDTFWEVIRKARRLIDDEEYLEFQGQIYDWYGEDRFWE